MPITQNYRADVAERGDETNAEVERESFTSATNGTLQWEAVHGELLADKHPEESVDRYVERMVEAARARGRELGPDGPLTPTPRTSGRVSAPSEYVTGTNDADWDYPDGE